MNMNDTIKIRLQQIGWGLEEDGKTRFIGKPMYLAIVDFCLLGEITKYKYENCGLTSNVQRALNKKKAAAIQAMCIGEIGMDKRIVENKWVKQNLPLSSIIDVVSEKVIETETLSVDGQVYDFQYLVLPKTESAMAELADCFNILDGQHSTYAFSSDCMRGGNAALSYTMPVLVYADLSNKERAFLFDNKNFDATTAKADQRFEHALLRDILTDDESLYSEILEILSEEKIRVSDNAVPRYTRLHNMVKLNETQKGRVSRSVFVKYALRTASQKVRDNNLISAMRKIGFKSKKTIAKALAQYMECFDCVHGFIDEKEVSAFTLKHGTITGTKIAMALAMAESCADVLAAKEMKWTPKNIVGVLDILKNDVLMGETFLEDKSLASAGGTNMASYIKCLRADLVKTCENMESYEIEERGKAAQIAA